MSFLHKRFASFSASHTVLQSYSPKYCIERQQYDQTNEGIYICVCWVKETTTEGGNEHKIIRRMKTKWKMSSIVSIWYLWAFCPSLLYLHFILVLLPYKTHIAKEYYRVWESYYNGSIYIYVSLFRVCVGTAPRLHLVHCVWVLCHFLDAQFSR